MNGSVNPNATIVFDYATQSGYRLTAKQRALQARVYEAAAKGVHS